MKSDLDARPVFLQLEQTIKGHFLICYLTVLLERILQFKVLGSPYSNSDILNFIKSFKVIKGDKAVKFWWAALAAYQYTEKYSRYIPTDQRKNIEDQ